MTTLTVNGIDYECDVDEKTPLLWVLRDVLGLTGTKYGCGISQCWACCVLMDGEAKKSCEIKLEDAREKDILTIEGLSPDPEHPDHPLQLAWIEHQVPQCGYCQSGMLMRAAEKFRQNPEHKDELANEMKNICICGTHQRIKNALRSL